MAAPLRQPRAAVRGRPRLSLLRQHQVLDLEVVPGVSHELRVAGMVDGLDADNRLHQLRMVLVNVPDQFGLGVGRPGDQDRAGVGDRSRHRLEKILILRGMAAADGICLVVDVPGRMIGMQRLLFGLGGAEMKHPGFVVIDPDGCVIMLDCHRISFRGMRPCVAGHSCDVVVA